jgi:replicative DNA helicase
MKQLPQAIDIEKNIISAILTQDDAFGYIDILPEDFYIVKHAKLFEVCINLHNQKKPVDMLTVIDELNKTDKLEECGGITYILDVSNIYCTITNLEYYCALIKDKSSARKLIELSTIVQQKSYNEDVYDVIEEFEKGMTEISVKNNSTAIHTIEKSAKDTLDYIKELIELKLTGKSKQIKTGLADLNKNLNGGWNAPDLIIIGGRPSMGKTQFAIHFSKNAGKQGKKTMFVSIEMTRIQLVLRMMLEKTTFDYYEINNGELTPEQLKQAEESLNEIAKYNINIVDDHNARNLNKIKSTARKLKRKGNLDLIIIDYLQLIRTNQKFGTRDIEVGFITSELKNLAKELMVPVILLAQLNRPVKGSKISSPKLEDLRESGNIEQDADIVIFPHRPTYYDDMAVDENNNSWKNRGGLIIAKNREGQRDLKVNFSHDERFKNIYDDIYQKNGSKIQVPDFYDYSTPDFTTELF